jgi:hypothetical protein
MKFGTEYLAERDQTPLASRVSTHKWRWDGVLGRRNIYDSAMTPTQKGKKSLNHCQNPGQVGFEGLAEFFQRKEFKWPDRSDPGVVDQPVQAVLGLLRYSVERLPYRRPVRYVHHYGGETLSRFALQSGPVRLAPHGSEHVKAVSC